MWLYKSSNLRQKLYQYMKLKIYTKLLMYSQHNSARRNVWAKSKISNATHVIFTYLIHYYVRSMNPLNYKI